MWIDRETGVILRSERIHPDGRLAQGTVFLSFQVMPRGWLNKMDPPADVSLKEVPPPHQITLAEAARRLGRTPVRVVPLAGFTSIAYYLSSGREHILQEVYSDGLSVLLLTYRQGTIPNPPRGSRVVQGRNGPVWVVPVGLRTLVHWSYGGWLLTMVGEVSIDSLLRSAERTGISLSPRVWDQLLAWLRHLRTLLRG